jgi:hypothetical protein
MDAFDSAANASRRNLLFVTAGAAAIGGSGGAAAQSPATPLAARIEPVTVKRRGVGLRGHDPDRAFAGFTLFSPLPSNNKTVYLIDMQGNVGRAPYRGGSALEMTWDGRILWEVKHPVPGRNTTTVRWMLPTSSK